MLDVRNTTTLIETIRNPDTPGNARVQGCALVHRLSALPAKDIISILQETIDDSRTTAAVLVKAMDLLDKISNSTGKEPELRSEDVDGVKTQLREKYLVCPGT